MLSIWRTHFSQKAGSGKCSVKSSFFAATTIFSHPLYLEEPVPCISKVPVPLSHLFDSWYRLPFRSPESQVLWIAPNTGCLLPSSDNVLSRRDLLSLLQAGHLPLIKGLDDPHPFCTFAAFHAFLVLFLSLLLASDPESFDLWNLTDQFFCFFFGNWLFSWQSSHCLPV